MVGLFALGIGGAVGVFLLLRVFLNTDPRFLARVVRWGGLALLAIAVALLFVTGYLGAALAFAALALPLYTRWRSAGRVSWSAAHGGRNTAGGSSQVETLYLRMTLDHGTGAMSGMVMHGPLRGRLLADLSSVELRELLATCRGDDPKSAALLEAWLDRTQSDWRTKDQDARARPHGTGAMTREEACDILGVEPDATPDQIRQAHRRLMMKVHPDHGGSTYLAAKINQAKDFLLRT